MKATDFNIPEGNLVGYRFPNKLQKDCGLAAYNMIIRFADDELTDKETISDKKIAGESENIGFKTNMNERLKKNNTPVEELDKSGLKENLQPSPIFVRALNIPGEDAAADPDVGQALVIVGDPTTDEFMKKDYQFHYGAVIAKSSSDIVTIEMFGSEGGSQSTNFVINMYSVGDAEGNSFHTHWKKNYFTGGAPETYIVGWL